MASIFSSFVFVSVAAVAVFALLVAAVVRRWFAGLASGFTVTLVAALVAVGLFAVWLSGTWGYRGARQIIVDQVVLDLRNVGDIVERQIQDELDEAFLQLRHFAAEVDASRLAQIPRGQLEHDLREVIHVDTRFLQLAIVDANGRSLAVTSVAASPQPFPHVGAGYCLDGKAYASDPYLSSAFARQQHGAREHIMDLCVPIGTSPTVAALTAQFDVQDNLSDLLASAAFNQSGRATLVGSDGHVLADPDPAHFDEDLSAMRSIQAALGGASGTATRTVNGREQLVFYRPVRNPATINARPWALLTQIDRAEAVAPLTALAGRILSGVLWIALASAIVGWAISVSITRPVRALVGFARRVREGDLTAHVTVGGRDAHAQLADALNDMVRGLRERDRVKEVFGRYVATQVSDKVLQGEVNLGGERRRVTILFSDIRNFTSMSEQLPPEQVVEFLNEYFSEMVDAVFEYGGMLDKFIGDGLLAVFGSTDDSPDHPKQAVLAALRMRARLAKINGDRAVHGKPPIAMGIGIHTDEVIVGNIGSRRRLEYTVIGDGVNTSSRLESLNKEFGTTILISETTYAAIKDAFVCRPMQQARLRGKSKDLAFYEVVSLAGEAARC